MNGPAADGHGTSPVRAVTRWAEGVPLRVRLLAILLVLVVLAVGALGWGVQVALRDYLTARADRELARTGRPAAEAVVAMVTQSGPHIEEQRVLPASNVALVTFEGYDPQPIPAPRNRADSAAFPQLPALTSEQAHRRADRPFDVRSRDGSAVWRARAYSIETRWNGQLVQGGLEGSVVVATPLAPVREALARLRFIVFLLGLLVTGACAGLGWFAVRRAFAPLMTVERTAAAIAAGDLSRRLPERPQTTEVGRLTSALNSMLTQIEAAFQARSASEARTRRFAADASHELRTPLATIRGFAELYRQGAVPPQEVTRTMRRIEDEAARMGGLVEDLLLLARLDEQRPGRSEPVDLAVLAGDAVHDTRGLAPGRAVRLAGLRPGSGPTPAVVLGDEDRLRQVVANLTGNAVRHTPPDAAVEVAVGLEADAGTGPVAVLEVRDHGQGLTPEQAERVFERFYRVDASRQRGQGGGSGLGLSIVAAVVAAHGGRVSVHATPGGGATFRIALPALQREDDPAEDALPEETFRDETFPDERGG